MRGAMSMKFYAAGLCAAVIAVTAVAIPPAEAQTTAKKKYVETTTRVAPASRPLWPRASRSRSG